MTYFILLFLVSLNAIASISQTPREIQYKENSDIGRVTKAMGADSSGGGSFFRTSDQQLVLLDFITQTNFDFTPQKGDFIKFRAHAKVMGFQYLTESDVLELSSYKLMLSQLKIWKDNSPKTIKLIIDELVNIKWAITPFQIPKYYKEDSIKAGAIFNQKFGVWISADQFNRTDLYSQAGLFLHEVLRKIKLNEKKSSIKQMTEETIHWLTSKIILTSPMSETELDQFSLYGLGTSFYRALTDNTNNSILSITLKSIAKKEITRFKNKVCEKRANEVLEKFLDPNIHSSDNWAEVISTESQNSFELQRKLRRSTSITLYRCELEIKSYISLLYNKHYSYNMKESSRRLSNTIAGLTQFTRSYENLSNLGTACPLCDIANYIDSGKYAKAKRQKRSGRYGYNSPKYKSAVKMEKETTRLINEKILVEPFHEY